MGWRTENENNLWCGIVYFDSAQGIFGWNAKRNVDECPRTALRGKAMKDINSDDVWKKHVEDYGMRVENIGIAVFQKQQEHALITISKRKAD